MTRLLKTFSSHDCYSFTHSGFDDDADEHTKQAVNSDFPEENKFVNIDVKIWLNCVKTQVESKRKTLWDKEEPRNKVKQITELWRK